MDVPRLVEPIHWLDANQEDHTADLLAVFRRLEARGKHETAHRTRQRASQVFRFAVATAALRRMGYSGEEMTWHGFRTIASTLLNQQRLITRVVIGT